MITIQQEEEVVKSASSPVAPKYSSAHSSLALFTACIYTVISNWKKRHEINSKRHWTGQNLYLAQEACSERFSYKLVVHVHVGPNVHNEDGKSLRRGKNRDLRLMRHKWCCITLI